MKLLISLAPHSYDAEILSLVPTAAAADESESGPCVCRMRTFDNKAELIAHLSAGYNNSLLPEQLETAPHHLASTIFHLYRQISGTCGPGDANDGTNSQLTDTFL